MQKKEYTIWLLLRFAMGFIFLWAFLDKLFGWGFATAAGKAWINGVSPTAGFLKAGVYGPLSSIFHSLSGVAVVDWLFMLGLLLIGASLITGIKMEMASYAGALLMFLMWLSLLPPKNNPILDEHIFYILIFIGLAIVNPVKLKIS